MNRADYIVSKLLEDHADWEDRERGRAGSPEDPMRNSDLYTKPALGSGDFSGERRPKAPKITKSRWDVKFPDAPPSAEDLAPDTDTAEASTDEPWMSTALADLKTKFIRIKCPECTPEEAEKRWETELPRVKEALKTNPKFREKYGK